MSITFGIGKFEGAEDALKQIRKKIVICEGIAMYRKKELSDRLKIVLPDYRVYKSIHKLYQEYLSADEARTVDIYNTMSSLDKDISFYILSYESARIERANIKYQIKELDGYIISKKTLL